MSSPTATSCISASPPEARSRRRSVAAVRNSSRPARIRAGEQDRLTRLVGISDWAERRLEVAPARRIDSRGSPMAINLVSLVSQFLTPQLVGALARAVGINEAVAQRLVAAAIPTILAAFATTAAAPGGAQRVVDAVSNSDPDLLTKLTGALSSGNVGALSRRREPARRPARRFRRLQHRRRPQPVRRSAAGRGAIGDRRCRPGGGRDDRPAGSVELVRPVVDRGAVRRAEGCDRRRAPARDLEGARSDRPSGRPRRPRRRGGPDGERHATLARPAPPRRPPRRPAPPQAARQQAAQLRAASGFPMVGDRRCSS